MIYSTAYGFSRVYGRLRFGRWRGSLHDGQQRLPAHVALLTRY